MTGRFDIAVIGGGMAGASVAAELADAGLSTVLLEMESQPGYHSSGRSAALLAPFYGNATIRRLTGVAEKFLRSPPEGFAEHPLLSRRPVAVVAREDQTAGLREQYAEACDDGQRLEWLDRDAVAKAVPHLKPDYAACGFYDAEAFDIDVHGLLQGYLRQLRCRGGEIRTGSAVRALQRSGDDWLVETAGGTLRAGRVVNAAGAWAGEVGALAGAAAIPMTPMRRTAVLIEAPAHLDCAALPMVVDADEEFYIKPEAGKLMASPGDETASAPCDAQPEELDVAICVDRIVNAFDIEVRTIEGKWAGLRSFVPDRSPVCGFDPQAPSFFWLAAQGGYGIQTAPALARLATTLITGVAASSEFEGAADVLDAISPQRFAGT